MAYRKGAERWPDGPNGAFRAIFGPPWALGSPWALFTRGCAAGMREAHFTLVSIVLYATWYLTLHGALRYMVLYAVES